MDDLDPNQEDSVVPPGLMLVRFAPSDPTSELVGYFQSSLRDGIRPNGA
jgi:hypothetical protein